MNKSIIMKNIALGVEWNWWKVKCWKTAARILRRRETLRWERLHLKLIHRMEDAKRRARELQRIYNIIYFEEY